MQQGDADEDKGRGFGRDLTNKTKNVSNQEVVGSKAEEKVSSDLNSFKELEKKHDLPYLTDIMGFLKKSEEKYLPDQDYMYAKQDDITEKMRAILIDWLIDVHTKFKLEANTLYITINIVDRFLSKVRISRKQLQLIGVASMLIACKFEEIYAPEVRDFVYISDEAYSKDEIIQMEGEILYAVKWDLCFTPAWTYLQHFGFMKGVNDKTIYLARYFIEESLTNYKMIKFEQDLIACAAIYLAMKFCRINTSWSGSFDKITGRDEADFRACAKNLCLCLKDAKKNQKFKAAKRKFSSHKYLRVSLIPELG